MSNIVIYFKSTNKPVTISIENKDISKIKAQLIESLSKNFVIINNIVINTNDIRLIYLK